MNRHQLRLCVINYNNWISESVDTKVRKILGIRPEELETIFRDLQNLINIIANDQSNIDSLGNKNRSYLKSAILYSLEIQKEEFSRRSALTDNREVIKKLKQKVENIAELTVADWFEPTEAFKTPKLEYFLIPQKKNDTQSTNNTKGNESILDLKPGLFGISINLNRYWDKVKTWFKRQRKKMPKNKIKMKDCFILTPRPSFVCAQDKHSHWMEESHQHRYVPPCH